ncbi:hypothetical protein QX776_01280 [Alteromonadaceae bacterium BrNp21-10]|nr:hypothetical protein [Alteromonadaceae bacterium BrNp21-10]
MRNIYTFWLGLTFLLSNCVVNACTVFLLTDDDNVFYFANENTSLSNAKIWFVPGGEDFYSAVYIGFNGAAETGMNSEGLIFDWVAQFDDKWDVEPNIKTVRGNYGQRMLEQSANLDDAITFFKKYPPPSLSKVRPMIADTSGAFAIIGVRDGKMFVDRYKHSHGMGTGLSDLNTEEMKKTLPEVSIPEGFKLLDRLREKGPTPTRYSSFFNPRTGEIRIKHQGSFVVTKFQLSEELKLGAHHYVVEDLHKHDKQKHLPLEISMHRFPIDIYKPIETQDPEVIKKVKRLIDSLNFGELTNGTTKKFQQELTSEIGSMSSELKTLGELQSAVVVNVEADNDGSEYLFRLEFANAFLLQKIRMDKSYRIDSMETVVFEMKGQS